MSSAIRSPVRRSVGPEMRARRRPRRRRRARERRWRPGRPRARRSPRRSRPAATIDSSTRSAPAVGDRRRGQRDQRGPPAWSRRRTPGRPCRRRCSGSRRVRPDPLAGAEEVAAVDLGEVLDAVGGRDGEVDRLAAGLARARRARAAPAPRRCARAGRARRRAGSPARGAGARARRPARPARGARARRPGARPCSWACRSRGQLGQGRPARSTRARGPAAARPGRPRWCRGRRRPQRRLELLFHVGILGPCTGASSALSRTSRRGPMFVNAMPRYEILSEDAMATLDRGWRRIVSELGIEFLLPEAVELLRAGRADRRGRQPRPLRSRLDPRAGREGAARVRAAGPQPRRTRRTSAATTWCSRPSTAARSSARATSAATRRWPTSRTSSSSPSRSPSSTPRAARSASPRTGRSTRATSTWCTRCRR